MTLNNLDDNKDDIEIASNDIPAVLIIDKITQEQKRTLKLQEYLKTYENVKRNENGLNILGGVYKSFKGSSNLILLDFDLLEFRKNGEVLKYIFLSKRQREAWRAFQDDENGIEEIVYGGAAGGGKSYILTLLVFINSLLLEGSSWFVGRRVLKDVKQSTITDLIRLMDDSGYEGYNHNQQGSIITYKNKSIIKYGELENLPGDPTFKRLGSFQYTGVFIDEAQETVVGAKSALRFRLRLNRKTKQNQDGTETIFWKKRGKMYYSCNPGKNWLFTDFFLPFEQGTLDKTKIFIQALPKDNEFIDDETLDLYRNSDNKLYKEIYYYGNWHYDNDPNTLFKYDTLNKMFEYIEERKSFGDEMYMTVDLAGRGKDKTVVIIWKGLKIIKIYTEEKTNEKELIKLLEGFENEYGIKRQNVAVDSSGLGGGFEDHYEGCLRFLGGSSSIEKLEEIKRKENGDEKQITKIKYANDRSACFIKLADEIDKGNIYIDDITYKEDIITELSFHKEEISASDTYIRKIISKENIKKFLSRSPDFADAISMRMIFNFNITEDNKDNIYGGDFVESMFF